jgi:hypothetical protein
LCSIKGHHGLAGVLGHSGRILHEQIGGRGVGCGAGRTVHLNGQARADARQLGFVNNGPVEAPATAADLLGALDSDRILVVVGRADGRLRAGLAGYLDRNVLR